MSTASEIEKRTLTLKRTFNAPRSLVWEAWTQPEHIAQWWARGMQLEIRKHDFRVGGDWEYAMPMPDGNEFISHGVYSKIVEPEQIESSANFIPMTEGVTIQAHFTEAGKQTEFVFKVIHPTEEYCKAQEEMGFFNGWGSVFGVLEAYLVGIS